MDPARVAIAPWAPWEGAHRREGPTEERVLPLSLTESRTSKRECAQQLTAGLLLSRPLAYESKPRAGVAPDTLVVHNHACRKTPIHIYLDVMRLL